MALRPFTITLANGRRVKAVRVPVHARLDNLAKVLNVDDHQGAIAVVGGAAGFDQPEYRAQANAVRQLFNELGALASERKIAVVDGGTDSGTMRILGEMCASHDYSFPLIGVAPDGKVTWGGRGSSMSEIIQSVLLFLDFDPGKPEPRVQLEENHSAFVLVKTEEWRGEVDILAQVTDALSPGRPSVEILVNGGAIARRDVMSYLDNDPQGQLIIIEGSGRFADQLANTVRSGATQEIDFKKILSSERVHLFPIESPPGAFRELVARLGGWQG